MNKLIAIINQIMHNQSMVWLLGTLVGVSCIAIYAGLKIGALILGIWTLTGSRNQFQLVQSDWKTE